MKGSSVQGHGRLSEQETLELVHGLQNHDQKSMLQLYEQLCGARTRYFLTGQLGSDDLLDHVHEVYLGILETVAGGNLREPLKLWGFIATYLHYYVYAKIEHRQLRRKYFSRWLADVSDLQWCVNKRCHPDEIVDQINEAEQLTVLAEAFSQLATREQQVLARFYLEAQSWKDICRDLKLSPGAFRCLKTVAKKKLCQKCAQLLRTRWLRARTDQERAVA